MVETEPATVLKVVVTLHPGWVCLFFAPLALLTGCSSQPLTLEGLRGEIVRIDQPPGEYYSVSDRRQPFTIITVRLRAGPAKGSFRIIKISVFDIYSPAIHGAVGDHVKFSWARRSPLDDDVPFPTLRAYHVLRSRPAI